MLNVPCGDNRQKKDKKWLKTFKFGVMLYVACNWNRKSSLAKPDVIE